MTTLAPAQSDFRSDVLIQVQGISKTFPMGKDYVRALSDVSLDIAPGEILALTGTNGSGKTTLLNCIGALDRPNKGEIVCLGKPLSGLSEDALAQHRLTQQGIVFQNFNLLPSLTALENVSMPMVLAGRLDEARAQMLLARVGLASLTNHYPKELSGGQQQRVAIARALALNPPLVLADEPTGNLDKHASLDVMRLLQELNQEMNTTIVFVTHDRAISKFAHRVILMDEGRIAQPRSSSRRSTRGRGPATRRTSKTESASSAASTPTNPSKTNGFVKRHQKADAARATIHQVACESKAELKKPGDTA